MKKYHEHIKPIDALYERIKELDINGAHWNEWRTADSNADPRSSGISH